MADGGSSITVTQGKLDRARAGEEPAVTEVTAVLSVCVEVAFRLLPDDPLLAKEDVRRFYLEAGLRIACVDGFALLSDWRQELQGPFEVHATTTIQLYFESLRSRDGEFVCDPMACSYWTPAMVVSALDRGGGLKKELESLLIEAVVRAVTAVHRRIGRLRWAKSVEDLENDVIKQIYETPGQRKAQQLGERSAKALRGYALRLWDPAKGLPLEAYVGLIAHRHAWRLCSREARRPDGPSEELEELSLRDRRHSPQVERNAHAEQVERYLHFDRVMASLSAMDQAIVRGKLQGKSSKEIAAELDTTPGNIDVRWSRIRARFK